MAYLDRRQEVVFVILAIGLLGSIVRAHPIFIDPTGSRPTVALILEL